MYKTSPVSASISVSAYPLENVILSTVEEALEGVPVELEDCPVIVCVLVNAVLLPLLSAPSSLNLVCT